MIDIALPAGVHVIGAGELSLDRLPRDAAQPVRIAAAQGVPRTDCSIVGRVQNYPRVPEWTFANLLMRPTDPFLLQGNAASSATLTLDGCRLVGPGPHTTVNGKAWQWSRQFGLVTLRGSVVSDCPNGFNGALAANCTFTDIGSDPLQNARAIYNCVVTHLGHPGDGNETDFHADVIQYRGDRAGIYVADLYATTAISSAGLFFESGGTMTNATFERVHINNQTWKVSQRPVLNIDRPMKGVVFRDCVFHGPVHLSETATMQLVKFERVSFTLPGVAEKVNQWASTRPGVKVMA